jgi:hypothetical protein
MGFTTMSESMSVTLIAIGDVVFECLGNSMTMPFTTKAPLQGESKKTDTFDIQMNNKGVSFF